MCLVFEVLGNSLLEILRKNDFHGFPLHIAKRITRQLLHSLSYLHSLDIAHTDIKPDNILLYHHDIEEILHGQIKAQAEQKLKERDDLRAQGIDPDVPQKPEKYISSLIGLTAEHIEMIAEKRAASDARKWPITPTVPIDSPLPFMVGRRLSKKRRLVRLGRSSKM